MRVNLLYATDPILARFQIGNVACYYFVVFFLLATSWCLTVVTKGFVYFDDVIDIKWRHNGDMCQHKYTFCAVSHSISVGKCRCLFSIPKGKSTRKDLWKWHWILIENYETRITLKSVWSVMDLILN